jgi:protein-disulfide isomerase
LRLKAADYITLTVAVAAIATTAVVLSRASGAESQTARVRTVNGERWSSLLDGGHVMGPARAEVKILEFSDFRCGFCGEFFHTVTEVQRRYPDNVALVYKHFVAEDGPSFEIALASECAAEQEAFDRFYRGAFTHAWKAADRDEISEFARSIGIGDMKRFEACMEDRLYADKVAEESRLARRLGFPGTPGVVINGVSMGGGAIRAEKLEQIVLVTLRRNVEPGGTP